MILKVLIHYDEDNPVMPVLLLNVCEENLEFILSDYSMVHAFFCMFYYVPNSSLFPQAFLSASFKRFRTPLQSKMMERRKKLPEKLMNHSKRISSRMKRLFEVVKGLKKPLRKRLKLPNF